MATVLVYRTSVTAVADIARLEPELNYLINTKGRWNFDLEDSDNILRVESSGLHPLAVVKTLLNAGFECEELPD